MKGEINSIVIVALFTIAVIILLPFTNNVMDYLTGKGTEEICRASVAIADRARFAGQSFTGFDCPKKEIKLDEDDDKDEYFRLFAEEMRNCWWKMGEGTLQPFSSEHFLGRETSCVVCAEIQGTEKVEEHQGFGEYLDQTLMRDSSRTYSEFMYREGVGTMIRVPDPGMLPTGIPTEQKDQTWLPSKEFATLQALDKIRIHKDYLVVYMMSKKSSLLEVPLIKSIITDNFVNQVAIPTITVVEKEDFGDLRCEDVFQ